MSPPDIRVVVPTHDRRELASRLVRRLLAQSIAVDRYEIVVVCDGCTDGTAAALRGAFRDAVTVIEQPRTGPGAARNRGAAGSSAGLVLFLDDDMRPADDLIERHREAQRRIGGGLVLGSLPVDPGSPRSFLTVGLARWAERRDARLRAAAGPVPFDEVLTGNLSVGSTALDRLGGFDPSFTDNELFGDEDLEFGWRAVALGVPIAYAPEAVAWQTFDKTFRALARDIRRGAAADARFVAKHPGALHHLTLGRVATLPGWDGRALRLAARRPGLVAPMAAGMVAVLDLAARWGATGPPFERAHALGRAAIYGLGLAEAGASSFASPRSTA